MATHPEFEVIGRKEAFQASRSRFFTGKPCKQGHIAQRYVSTGACVDCLNPYKLRVHPLRKDLQPYACPKLWVPKTATLEQYVALEKYLQACIERFFEHTHGGR